MAARIKPLSIYPAAISLFLSLLLPISLRAAQSSEQQSSPQNTSDPKSAAAPTGQISGQVYRSDNGAPIPKAIVILRGFSDSTTPAIAPQSIRTAGDGSFSFSDLPQAKYEIEAFHQGFTERIYTIQSEISGTWDPWISLGPGQRLDTIEFHLNPTSVISGKVTDEDGDPVVGIKVSAVRPAFQPGGIMDAKPDKNTTTDDRGEFRLADLVPGTYLVRAGGSEQTTGSILGETLWNYRPAYYPAASRMDTSVEIPVAAGAEVPGIEIHVTSAGNKTYAIAGQVPGVSDETFADVSLIFGDELVSDEKRDFKITGDGYFVIPGVSPGQYTILVTTFAPDGSRTVAHNSSIMEYGVGKVAIENQNAKVLINLGRSGDVHGRIVLDDLRPPPADDLKDLDIDLDAESGIGTLKTQYDGKIDPNGMFAVENLSPGKYWFSTDIPSENEYFKQITCDGKDFTAQPIDINVGTSMNCEIILGTDAAKITGKLMDDDKPVPDYVVVAIPEPLALRRVPYFLDDERTNKSGEFRFIGMAPGDYLLFAVPRDPHQGYYAPDFADRNMDDAVRVTVKPNETVTLTLKPTIPM